MKIWQRHLTRLLLSLQWLPSTPGEPLNLLALNAAPSGSSPDFFDPWADFLTWKSHFWPLGLPAPTSRAWPWQLPAFKWGQYFLLVL